MRSRIYTPQTPEEILLAQTDSREVQPTTQQTNHFLRTTYQHILGVERTARYIEQHHPEIIHTKDTQRPHDAKGPHHKLTWPVFRGLALFPEKNRKTLAKPVRHVIERSLEWHRQQDHHNTLRTHYIGALDALHSILENRGYQGGSTPIEGLEHFINKKMWPDMRPAATQILPILKEIGYINLNQYRTIDTTPNPELPQQLFDQITDQTKAFADRLQNIHGYLIHV